MLGIARVALPAALVWMIMVGSAAAAAELQVSPVIINVDAMAGETLTEQIQVTASGDEPIVVEFSHVDFGFDGSTYAIRIIRDDTDTTTAFSTRGWFSVPQPRYTVAAGASVNIPVRIEVPGNTPGGTYLGGAFLRIVPQEAGSGSQVQAVAETGPLLFIRVAGGDPPEPSIEQFSVPGLVSGGPVTPRIVVGNEGDDYFTFEGTIRLSGPGKDDTVRVDRQYVVPGAPRSVRTAPGVRGAKGRPALGPKRLAFGRYEVTSRLRIEPTGTTLVHTRSFWVVPIWMRILGAIALVALAASIAVLGRWLVVRARRPAPTPLDEVEDSNDEPSLS